MTTIEELAARKDFEALSPDERRLVLAEMPREEYARLRLLLRDAAALDRDAAPPAALRGVLLDAMRQHAQKPVPQKWFQRAMPLWQAGLLLTGGISVALFFYPEKKSQPETPAPLLRVDTVFVEKTVWRDRVVYRTKIVEKQVQTIDPVAFVPPGLHLETPISDSLNEKSKSGTQGTSLADDPALMEFFTK